MNTVTATTRTANIGSISHGTLRPVDLLSTFADELEFLRNDCADLIMEARNMVNAIDESDDGAAPDGAYDIVTELEDALSECAPSYCYFGAHPGDASDFGFWLDDEWRETLDTGKANPCESMAIDPTCDAPRWTQWEALRASPVEQRWCERCGAMQERPYAND